MQRRTTRRRTTAKERYSPTPTNRKRSAVSNLNNNEEWKPEKHAEKPTQPSSRVLRSALKHEQAATDDIRRVRAKSEAPSGSEKLALTARKLRSHSVISGRDLEIMNVPDNVFDAIQQIAVGSMQILEERAHLETADDTRRMAMKKVLTAVPEVRSKACAVNDAIQDHNDFVEHGDHSQRNILKEKCVATFQATREARATAVDIISEIVAANDVKFLSEIAMAVCTDQILEAIKQYGENMPLYIGKARAKALVGRYPLDIKIPLKQNELVVVSKPAEPDDIWLLATVVRQIGRYMYLVSDIDVNGNGKHEGYVVFRRDIIPLPKWRANPATHPLALFPPLARVSAMCPQTTCFYDGIVNAMPAGTYDPYTIQFDDEHGFSPPASVPQRYVIAQVPKKKQKKAEVKNERESRRG